MTTIVYDGKVLVADGLSTTKNPNAACKTCGTNATKERVKIFTISSGAVFEGSKILALATFGAVKDSGLLTKMISLGIDFSAGVDLLRYYVGDHIFQPSGGVVILTETSAWEVVLGCNGRFVDIYKKEIVDLPYSVGSGSKAALTGMRFMGLDAVKAVMLAAEIDKSTGSHVNLFSREKRVIERIELDPKFPETLLPAQPKAKKKSKI